MTKPSAPALKFPRECLVLMASIALACPMAFAQSPAVSGATSPAPAFDAATIKPQSATQRDWMGVREMPDGLNASGASLYWLVESAYGLPLQSQVTGGPDWAKTEPYDIQAKMTGADAEALKTLSAAEQKTRRQLMLQALLADRFKLKTHTETRQVPVFDLVTTKDTSKLKVAATDADIKMDKDGKPSTGSIRFGKDSANVMGESMSSFAGFLSGPMSGAGRPVVDKTGLSSTYNFTLNWSISSARASSTSDSADDIASIFGALNEVGLKLQPSTGPIETIVIDRAERPSEN